METQTKTWQESRSEVASKKDVLATREDILSLKLDMERGFRDNLKWTIGTVLAAVGLIIAMVKIH